MWRRVPCEQQLNMGQPVLREAVKTVAKVLDFLIKWKGTKVFLEGELG
jgi:hypothetical protein